MLYQRQGRMPGVRGAGPRYGAIDAVGLVKNAGGRAGRETILRGIDLDIPRGGLTAIVGPSGAGKTSLLYCLSGLDRPDSGRVLIDGVDVYALGDERRARFMRGRIGFVFQQYNLVPYLTAEENVSLPLVLARRRPDAALVARVLRRFGLDRRARLPASMLSGGEQQRVALCRALAVRPPIVFADEPTGALDTVNTELVLQVLRELAGDGSSVVMVTHDTDAAAMADRVVFMRDGMITHMAGHLDAGRIVEGMRRTLAAPLARGTEAS